MSFVANDWEETTTKIEWEAHRPLLPFVGVAASLRELALRRYAFFSCYYVSILFSTTEVISHTRARS